ncbi:hypothetical protein RRG08_025757 [Elysia crispata]|uniref:Uncharacterized protein n=1 Tax=Elysia crispata TaxID=231223 RepID=A0AAE1AH92_9GAST|nr:hypothetical protein RRG08_025757 [Elysia crispata]
MIIVLREYQNSCENLSLNLSSKGVRLEMKGCGTAKEHRCQFLYLRLRVLQPRPPLLTPEPRLPYRDHGCYTRDALSLNPARSNSRSLTLTPTTAQRLRSTHEAGEAACVPWLRGKILDSPQDLGRRDPTPCLALPTSRDLP